MAQALGDPIWPRRWLRCRTTCGPCARICAGTGASGCAATTRSATRRPRVRCRSSPISTTLIDQLGQEHPGATLDDVDVETVQRALGPGAAQDVRELQRLERELERQGWLVRGSDGLELSPKALAPARPDRVAPGVRPAVDARPRRPRPARRRRRGRADRRLPRLAVRRRAAAGRGPHGQQRHAAARPPARLPWPPSALTVAASACWSRTSRSPRPSAGPLPR